MKPCSDFLFFYDKGEPMKDHFCQRCHNKEGNSVKTDKYTLLCNECCREYLNVVSEILVSNVTLFMIEI